MNEPATATKRRVSGYDRNPDYRIEFLAAPGRVRVLFNGVTVADSGRAMEMREGRYPPVYYLPREDVRMDLLRRTGHRSHCPYKGDASYWTLSVGEREAENAVWSYEGPFDQVAQIKDYLAFYQDRVDAIQVDRPAIAATPTVAA